MKLLLTAIALTCLVGTSAFAETELANVARPWPPAVIKAEKIHAVAVVRPPTQRYAVILGVAF